MRIIDTLGKVAVKIGDTVYEHDSSGIIDLPTSRGDIKQDPDDNTWGKVVLESVGSTCINITVVGGETEPENPTENMVWVKTETAITKVVLIQEGSNASNIDGAVSITYSPSSDYCDSDANIPIFEVENIGATIQEWVELTKCTQRKGNTQVTVNAYILKDGAWVQFSFENYYIIKNGVAVVSLVFIGNYTNDPIEDLFYLRSKTNNTCAFWASADMSNYKKAKIDIASNSTYVSQGWKGVNVPAFCVSDTAPTISGDNVAPTSMSAVTYFRASTGVITDGVYEINIDQITGKNYVCASTAGSQNLSGTYGNLYIRNMWLE